LTAKNVRFQYKKKGAVPISDNGEADVKLVLGAQAVLRPSADSSFPHYDSSSMRVETCDVSFHGTGKDSIYDVVWPLIRKSIVGKIEGKGRAWLESQLSYLLPPKATLPPPRKPRRSSRYEPMSAGVTSSWIADATHGDARDRFRNELRRNPGLRTDVLSKLESPFSNPPSAAASEIEEEISRLPSPKPVRRKSMAEYLTNVSSQDATLETNISSPPVASVVGLPTGFHEDESVDYEYMAASLSSTARRDTTTPDAAENPPIDPSGNIAGTFAHRGRAPSRYAGEMSFEEYEKVTTADKNKTTMARSLSEVASRDATTVEAIRKPPSAGPGSAAEQRFAGATQPPMNKVTRDLSGLPDDVTITNSPIPMGTPKLGLRSMSAPERPAAGLRTLSRMSDVLTDATTQDYTSPEAQVAMHRTGSRGASEQGETGFGERELKERRKSFALNEEAMRDATLPENIASPPVRPTPTTAAGTRPRASSRVSSTSPSTFTGLRNVLPMGATLDDALEEDLTLPERQAEYHRMSRSNSRGVDESKESFTGLDSDSLKKRRMSSFLSDSAKQDATLYDNVASVRVLLLFNNSFPVAHLD
jgi:hypothetical protein